VLLEVQAQVEQRLAQQSVRDELQSDQKPADTTVAVQEWMDGFELHVRKTCLDKGRHGFGIVVQKALEMLETGVSLEKRT
jgi:hypothetical protein